MHHLHQHPHQDLTAALADPESLTVLCKASADTLRLMILRLLRNDSLGVLEMCRIFDVRQSALSHHLKVLASAGLVSTRREGNAIFYRRALLDPQDALSEFKASLLATVDRITLDGTLSQRLRQIKQERTQQSLDFFQRNAHKFRENQELVAAGQQYIPLLEELLQGTQLPATASALEIGPGDGWLLPLLAGKFKQVIALDASAEMLDKARATAARNGVEANVSFIHGDTEHALQRALRADLLVSCMVLHHVSSPAEVMLDAASLLEEAGMFLVVELCRHDQDWVRASCGDLWLGFEPEELTNWAHRAGFTSSQSLYQSLRNGFQVQMHLFAKGRQQQPFLFTPLHPPIRHDTTTKTIINSSQ